MPSSPPRAHHRLVAVASLVLALGACTEAPLHLQSALVAVNVTREPLRITVTNRASGEVVAEQAAPESLGYERFRKTFALGAVEAAEVLGDRLVLSVASSEGGEATVIVRLRTERDVEITVVPPSPETVSAISERVVLADSEAIYGLTERPRDSELALPGLVDIPTEDVVPVEVGTLDRRGERVEMFVRPTIALYTPFHHSSRGAGIYVEGTMPGRYDLGATDPKVLSLRFEVGRAQNLRYHVLFGPDYAAILEAYTALAGRPFVPPDWAFLNWRWRDELAAGAPGALDGVPMNAELVDDVTHFESLGIPPGVYLFDRPVFQGEYGFARFAWDEARMPNPAAMLDALRRRGYRTLIWSSLWTCGAREGDDGTVARARGFHVPGEQATPHCADLGGTSFILDPTNPDAYAWWRDIVADFLRTNGIDGIKLDRGEEHLPSDVTDVWADGRTGREVHNDYPNLQAQLHYDALKSARGDDFLLAVRGGYAGTQRYAVAWGGDIPGSESFGNGPSTDLGLRAAILAQLRAGFMGYPIWGSDTGGYYEFKDREVFARWMRLSAFSGIMEIGGKGTHAPWDMPTSPRQDDEVSAIYRDYTRLRARLQPYVVAAAKEAGRTGLPIARPLAFLDRTDPALRDLWDEYMFGPDLLVAPIWRSGARAREVYFPAGTWRSFWDPTEVHEGPGTATVSAPLERIPVYVHGDAIIP